MASVDDVGARFDDVVTYHDSCHALREFGIKDGPRRLLSQGARTGAARDGYGRRVLRIRRHVLGEVSEVSGGMARTKIDSILRTGAKTVVSIDSSCLMQLQGALSRAESADPDHASGRGSGQPLGEILCPPYSTRRFKKTLADANLQLAIYTATGRLIDHRKHAFRTLCCPDYQELRTQANAAQEAHHR